jgi:hypothetical protein
MKLRLASLSLILSFLFISNEGLAQSKLKNIAKSIRSKNNNDDAKNVVKEKKSKKKQEIDLPKSLKRMRYRIDVVLPLNIESYSLDKKSKTKLTEMTQSSLSFIEGVKLAVDTLKHLDYQADVYVHDIPNTDVLNQIVKNDSFQHSDLIIGFVPVNQVESWGLYAASKKINFLSAFAPSDANISNNPYFLLLNPSLESNCQAILNQIEKKKYTKRPLLIYRTSISIDSTAFGYFNDEENKKFESLSCKLFLDSLQYNNFDSATTNVIVMPIMDANYAENIINNIKKTYPDYTFEIYGMPSWKSITTTKKMQELGDNIKIFTTNAYHFDGTVSKGVSLTERYKAKYGGRISDFGIRGYEITLWMVDLLDKYGTIFNQHMKDNSMASFTNFSFTPKWDKENNFYYFENKNLYLYQYHAGNVLVENP